ncbi:hypothetical protein ACFWXB_19380 [Tsukamurella tyrosinosolvens]|nr:hypothetical protein [Tsukamurella tyrosinosolvens]QRY86122.1 hypothetical protein JVY00_08750 [Tsukamurella tyrosinosolvens]
MGADPSTNSEELIPLPSPPGHVITNDMVANALHEDETTTGNREEPDR